MPLERLKKHTKALLATNDPSQHTIQIQPRTSSGSDTIISDSEEERIKLTHQARKVIEVIEISSDESEVERVDSTPASKRVPTVPPKAVEKSLTSRLYFSRRRIIESSDEDEESEHEVIEISDSSIEVVVRTPTKKLTNSKPSAVRYREAENDDPSNSSGPAVDESIIIFDEPKSARKPLRLETKKRVIAGSSEPLDWMPHSPKKPSSLPTRLLISNTPDLPTNASESSTTMARTKVPLKAPRANTKRAREVADLQRRQDYAQKLFNELNNVVFKGALPPDTKLQWSKRLLSTAGKAKYHRSREGVETIEIELADKILDCDERIRNTLSHEMCHLATWVIDHNVREQHGKLFQNWAAQVMKKRPDIHVSIKHNYDITYPFEWECQKCAKVYGRFSNSINVDECACGACKDGKLKPLFTSKRKVDTPKQSRMAAAKPKDSPSTRPTSTVSELDSNSQDIEFIVDMLTQTIASTSLT